MKKQLKKIIILLLLLAVIILDWAALNDILKGNEDNCTNEYLILLLSIVILGIAGYLFITGRVNGLNVNKS